MIILDIAIKDMKRSLRSWFAIGMMLLGPLLLAGLIYLAFGAMYSGQGTADTEKMTGIKVIVVNQDQPTQGEENYGKYLENFLQSDSLRGILESSLSTDKAAARDAVSRGEVAAVIIIPAGFSEAVVSPLGSASVFLLEDPAQTTGLAILENLLNQFIDAFSGARIGMNVIQQTVSAQGGQVDPTRWPGVMQELGQSIAALSASRSNTIQTISPTTAKTTPMVDFPNIMAKVMAGLMVFMGFYAGAYTPMSLLRESEEGTLARQFATAVPRWQIIAGSFLAVVLTLTGQWIVLMIASSLIFGVSWGQPATILLAGLGMVIGSSGFGIFLISLVKNTKQAGPVLGGGITVTGMLGGLFTTNIPMPQAFQTLNLFFPQGWSMLAWKQSIDGADWISILTPLAVLLVVGAVGFTLGTLIFRKRFALEGWSPCAGWISPLKIFYSWLAIGKRCFF